LEEDHYVAEDFIDILRLMKKATNEHCPRCNILSLGSYLKTYNYYGDSKNVSRIPILHIFVNYMGDFFVQYHDESVSCASCVD
jgi:hypothetical protein